MEKGFRKIEEIEIWKRGCRLAVNVYNATKVGELEKDWGLKDQLRRSAVSIPSNIAEGYERESDTEFRRFLMIAKGSCGELRTQIYIAEALNYIEKSASRNLINECVEISSMIHSLVSQLEKRLSKE